MKPTENTFLFPFNQVCGQTAPPIEKVESVERPGLFDSFDLFVRGVSRNDHHPDGDHNLEIDRLPELKRYSGAIFLGGSIRARCFFRVWGWGIGNTATLRMTT
jgi:hypothetical protein